MEKFEKIFFDKTFHIANFSYTNLVKIFLQNIENIFKEIVDEKSNFVNLTLYKKSKFYFDTNICTCCVQKHIEPCYINIYIRNTFVRDSLGKNLLKESIRSQQVRDIFGIKAVEANIIALHHDQRTFKWASNGKKLMQVPFEEHPYSALASWFKTDEGLEVYKSIQKKLK